MIIKIIQKCHIRKMIEQIFWSYMAHKQCHFREMIIGFENRTFYYFIMSYLLGGSATHIINKGREKREIHEKFNVVQCLKTNFIIPLGQISLFVIFVWKNYKPFSIQFLKGKIINSNHRYTHRLVVCDINKVKNLSPYL